MWICPHCQQLLSLSSNKKSWLCESNHNFDCAKEGYVNLLPANKKRSSEPGDSATMLEARRRVHDAQLYRELAEAIVAVIASLQPLKSVLDLGCGEGFYSDALYSQQPGGQVWGVDISKSAVRLAAKRHSNIHFAVASAFDLPLANDSMDLVCSVFAPNDEAEMLRVLKPQGYYLKVTPAGRHLWQLREALYPRPQEHKQAPAPSSALTTLSQQAVRYEQLLDRNQLADVIAMTPFAHRGDKKLRERLLTRPNLEVEMAFSIDLYRAAEIEQLKPVSPWAKSRAALNSSD